MSNQRYLPTDREERERTNVITYRQRQRSYERYRDKERKIERKRAKERKIERKREREERLR